MKTFRTIVLASVFGTAIASLSGCDSLTQNPYNFPPVLQGAVVGAAVGAAIGAPLGGVGAPIGIAGGLVAGSIAGVAFHHVTTTSDLTPKTYPTIYFNSTRGQLDPSYYDELNNVAKVLRHHSYMMVTLTGYSNTNSSLKANNALAMQYAMAVKQYLLSAGVQPSQIEVLSVGARDHHGRCVTVEMHAVPGYNQIDYWAPIIPDDQ